MLAVINLIVTVCGLLEKALPIVSKWIDSAVAAREAKQIATERAAKDARNEAAINDALKK